MKVVSLSSRFFLLIAIATIFLGSVAIAGKNPKAHFCEFEDHALILIGNSTYGLDLNVQLSPTLLILI